jgi:hypothetical protein
LDFSDVQLVFATSEAKPILATNCSSTGDFEVDTRLLTGATRVIPKHAVYSFRMSEAAAAAAPPPPPLPRCNKTVDGGWWQMRGYCANPPSMAIDPEELQISIVDGVCNVVSELKQLEVRGITVRGRVYVGRPGSNECSHNSVGTGDPTVKLHSIDHPEGENPYRYSTFPDGDGRWEQKYFLPGRYRIFLKRPGWIIERVCGTL